MNRAIEENYQIISAVNLGGAYRMYVAEHRQMRTRWAIKEIVKPADAPADCLDRAKAVQQMNDPLLPSIRELYDDGETFCAVEEYIPGVSLKAFVEQTEVMDEGDVLQWLNDIAGFLHRIHGKKLLFGCFEPSNLRLLPDNSVRIADYSTLCALASPYDEDRYGFTAPEYRRGGKLGPWSDIYSLGAAAYYALTGKDPDEQPFRFFPVRRLNPRASAGIEYILNKCLQQNPKLRYQSAAELLFDLQRIKRFNKVLTGYKFKRFMRRAVLALMVVGGAALMLYGRMTMAQELRDNYRVMLNNSAALADEGSFDAAFIMLGDAQQLMPEDVRSYEQWAEFLYAKGDYVGCADYCAQQLALFPDSKPLVLQLAMSDYAIGEYRLAGEYFRLAGVENMDNDQLFQYVMSLIRLDRTAEAGVLYSDNASRWDYATAYYIQGELYAAQGDYAEAEAALTGAINESADDALRAECIKLLARVYISAAQAEDSGIASPAAAAVTLLESAIADERYANDPQLFAVYGSALMLEADNNADWAKAAEYLEKAVRAGLNDEETYLMLCQALSACGDHEGALAYALDAQEIYQQSWRVRARSAWEEIVLQEEKSADLRDYSVAYGEYSMAESLIGDDEPDELMTKLREKIQRLSDDGLIGQ